MCLTLHALIAPILDQRLTASSIVDVCVKNELLLQLQPLLILRNLSNYQVSGGGYEGI
jgi:hypothetical protein